MMLAATIVVVSAVVLWDGYALIRYTLPALRDPRRFDSALNGFGMVMVGFIAMIGWTVVLHWR